MITNFTIIFTSNFQLVTFFVYISADQQLNSINKNTDQLNKYHTNHI